MKRIPLIDVFETPETSIIHSIERFDVPWKNNTYSVPTDMDYLFNHSATRIISRMVFILLNGHEKLTQNAIDILGETIYKMYSRKWNKLYNTFSLEYNPIENYDMEEQMINDTTEHNFNHTNTRTDNLQSAKQGGNTVTHNTTDTRTDNLTATDENKVEGFNSTDYQPSTYEEIKNTGTQALNKTGTDTTQENLTDNQTGTQTFSDTGKNTDTRNYKLTRHGNIGVTTAQQMIQSERELWEFYFTKTVYTDLDRVLTIDYYLQRGDNSDNLIPWVDYVHF